MRTAAYVGDPHWWLGRLSTALATAPNHPKVAQDALAEYLRSPVVTPEEKAIIEKLRRTK